MIRFVALGLAALGLLTTACDTATVEVFVSAANDGTRSPAAPIPTDGTAVDIPLWIENVLPMMNPPAPSPEDFLCLGSGDGPEVCMWGVTFTPSGAVQVVSFTPAAGVRFRTTGNTVRANGGDPSTASAAPQPIGVLRVRATGGGQIDVSGKFVNSKLELPAIRTGTIASAPAPS
jgi:hypothetical protein